MALLHLLAELSRAGECQLAGVGHLNHCLRGEAADQDEALSREAAAGLHVPFECERIDVSALARERRMSIEAAGHEERYAFLERAAARVRADRVAIGHTRDDQAETFLLRLLRGAGPRGLAGIRPRTGPFIRPMLDCSRRQVRQFVSSRGIVFHEDASNDLLTIPRNRIRHQILPALSAVSPGIVRVLAREAAIARDDGALLDEIARAASERTVRSGEDGVEIDVERLRAEPEALARRVAASALAQAAGGRFVGFDHVEALLDLVRADDLQWTSLHLPGQVAERRGTVVLLKRQTGRGTVLREGGTNSFRFSLSIPGEVASASGWTISAGEHDRWPAEDGHQGGTAAGHCVTFSVPRSWALLDRARLSSPLVVRNWLPGDRIRPFGMSGSRKLQDLFVDRKVPRERRADVPVVVDASDHVVWVAGHAISEDFRVTARTSDVVILKLKYWRIGT